jgi:hypothetical protein
MNLLPLVAIVNDYEVVVVASTRNGSISVHYGTG